MDLQGKVALVTGGAVRVGKAIALGLAEAGADVAFSYHSSAAEAAETAAEIKGKGRRTFAYQADLARAKDAQALVEATVAHLGRLDILVNSASLWRKTPLHELDEAVWDQVIGILLKGAAFCAKAAARHLAAHGEGVIINILDMAAFVPFPDYIAHSAGKAGLLNLTYALAMELAPAVRVNAVAPGPVLPPPNSSPQQIEVLARRTLLGRWGTPQDVAQAVVFLARADYITGVVLPVDGGESLGCRRRKERLA